MTTNYLNIIFVIDESGSMEGSNDDVIGGFNTYIDKHRDLNETNVTVSLYKFNHQITRVFAIRAVGEVRKLTHSDYTPGSFTALFDAIGQAITETDHYIETLAKDLRPTTNLMVIITDGQENASREYSSTALKAMIATHETQLHWQFIFLGADLNNFDDAHQLGIRNHLSFDKKNMSTKFSYMADAVMNYTQSDDAGFNVDELMEKLED